MREAAWRYDRIRFFNLSERAGPYPSERMRQNSPGSAYLKARA